MMKEFGMDEASCRGRQASGARPEVLIPLGRRAAT